MITWFYHATLWWLPRQPLSFLFILHINGKDNITKKNKNHRLIYLSLPTFFFLFSLFQSITPKEHQSCLVKTLISRYVQFIYFHPSNSVTNAYFSRSYLPRNNAFTNSTASFHLEMSCLLKN